MPSFICHVTVKVFIDQFIQAPILLAFIITGMGLMQGEWIGELQEDLQKQYVSTLIANCKCWWISAEMYGGSGISYCLVSISHHHCMLGKLWIPATIVNIAFISPILRVTYDNLVFFIWTIILSIMLNDWTGECETKENERDRHKPTWNTLPHSV